MTSVNTHLMVCNLLWECRTSKYQNFKDRSEVKKNKKQQQQQKTKTKKKTRKQRGNVGGQPLVNKRTQKKNFVVHTKTFRQGKFLEQSRSEKYRLQDRNSVYSISNIVPSK